jgi:2-polyprenyl-3-methyl-5-hydroxy-6-metoxy-1,4-benzoquinol methylase
VQRSKLDEMYSLSNTITRKEMVSRISTYDQIDLSNKQEPMKYIDQYTGKVKSEISYMRDKCPLCDSKTFNYLFTKHGFDHMLCNTCELIFTLQVLDTEKIKFLEEGKEGNTYGLYKMNPVANERDRKKFEAVFEILEQYGKIKNIFDFGSQAGTFLDWAREKYSIVGHEYHRPLRETAQEKGHVVLDDNLEILNLDREVDLMTCWDYLDHVLKPREVIKNLTKYLRKNGLFFFAINNRDSLSARIMHGDSPMFVGPHHTMHYGINQLKLLMKDYEFLYADSYVSELNWISNWLNFKNPEFGDSSLMYELLDPKKICELGMGIKVNAIFKKK